MDIDATCKRYSKGKKEMVACIKEHLEQLNATGEHVSCNKGNWTMDDEAVSVLDSLLGYYPPKPEEAHKLKEENAKLQQAINTLQESLKKSSDALDSYKAQSSKDKAAYERRIDELTAQVLAIKNSHESINNNLIRSYQTDAEKARSELERVRQNLTERISMKENRIQELEKRVSALQTSLADYNDMKEKVLEAENRAVISGREQDRLLKDLHERENNISSLEDAVEQAKEKGSTAVQAHKFLREDVLANISSLEEVIKSLKESVGVSAEASPIAEHAAAAPSEAIVNPAPRQQVFHPSKSSTPITAERDLLMEELRQAQAERENEEKKGGFLKSLFGKAASFVG